MFNIDGSRCTGCGICVDACPQQAISIQSDTAVINQHLCRQCGICAGTCPVNAIYDVTPVFSSSREGGDEMRGRSWPGRGHRGRGRGNPYPFCRFYPGPPRRWWAYSSGLYPSAMPALYPFNKPYSW